MIDPISTSLLAVAVLAGIPATLGAWFYTWRGLVMGVFIGFVLAFALKNAFYIEMATYGILMGTLLGLIVCLSRPICWRCQSSR